MSEPRRKRLIEVAFPLEEVSAHSRREKKVRHGHISNACTSVVGESAAGGLPRLHLRLAW